MPCDVLEVWNGKNPTQPNSEKINVPKINPNTTDT
jgi:hypothetical protein